MGWFAGLAGAMALSIGALATPALPADQAACIPAADTHAGAITVSHCEVSGGLFENSADAVENYYGRVLLDVAGSGNFDLDRHGAEMLAAMLGISKSYTAVVTLDVYMYAAGEETLVFSQPLYRIDVDKSGKAKANLLIVTGNDIAVTPYFALSTSNSQIRTKLKIARVSTTDIKVLSKVTSVVDIAARFGGHGWLITGLTEDKFLAAASHEQAELASLLSSETNVDLDTYLDFNNRRAFKEARFTITVPADKGSTSSLKATLRLEVLPSLIFTNYRRDSQGILRPDLTQTALIPGSPWAMKIQTDKDQTLQQYLANRGVPQKLDVIAQLPSNGKEPVDQVTVINAACVAVRDALRSWPYKVSENDADLVLYDTLRNANVFTRVPAEDIPCVRARLPIWKDRYGLVIAPLVVAQPTPDAQKVNRLLRIATGWDAVAKTWDSSDAPSRGVFLQPSFVSPAFMVVAPDGMFPALIPPDADGNVSFPSGVQTLANKRKACFGNFKPTNNAEPWATGFVRFAKPDGTPEDKLYLVKFWFRNTEAWSAQEGPLVEKVEFKLADEADRKAYNQNSNCF